MFTHSMSQRLGLVCAALALGLGNIAPAQAAMVDTGQVLAQHTARANRATLALQRRHLQTELTRLGVAPSEARGRVAALSDAQVRQLNQHLDELPAGSGLVGTIVFVVVVLGITDLLGYTDVFPFIDPISKK